MSSPIAQLVEQMTVNHWVAGSSPAWGASRIRHLAPFRLFLIPPQSNLGAKQAHSKYHLPPKTTVVATLPIGKPLRCDFTYSSRYIANMHIITSGVILGRNFLT